MLVISAIAKPNTVVVEHSIHLRHGAATVQILQDEDISSKCVFLEKFYITGVKLQASNGASVLHVFQLACVSHTCPHGWRRAVCGQKELANLYWADDPPKGRGPSGGAKMFMHMFFYWCTASERS